MVRASTKEANQGARLRAGRVFLNVKGRPAARPCEGDGVLKIENAFFCGCLRHLRVCKGALQPRTLEVLFKGKSIADVLDLTVEEGRRILKGGAAGTANPSRTLHRRWPRYIHVGQKGHHAVRRFDAHESSWQKGLSKRPQGARIYIRMSRHGLNFHDVQKPLGSINDWGRRATTGGGDRAQPRSQENADWVIETSAPKAATAADGNRRLARRKTSSSAAEYRAVLGGRCWRSVKAEGEERARVRRGVSEETNLRCNARQRGAVRL